MLGFLLYIVVISNWAQMGSFGLGPLTETDFYKASASENMGINRGGLFKASVSINQF